MRHSRAARLLALLLPLAERDELATDIDAEHGARSRRDGRLRAEVWLWAQVVRSTPALIRRTWTRATTGFEPHANAMNPGGPHMERLILEARYALRRLKRRPAYASLAITTLAIGVGGLAAIAGIVRPLFVDGLPYPRAEQLAELWRAGDWNGREITALRGEWTGAGFTAVAGYHHSDLTLERDGEPARLVPAIAATSELFSVLGVSPMIGRGFAKGEDVPGSPPVVVLSHMLWQQFGGDTRIIGKTVRLDGVQRTVIGVMPAGFWFPDPAVGAWISDSLVPNSPVGFYTLIGRVAGGQRVERMQAPLERMGRLLSSRFEYGPPFDPSKNVHLTPMRELIVGPLRPVLFATLAGLAVILFMACTNVGALVLGQVEERATELSVRAALGADRGRIATQLIIETLMLGAAAGLLGGLAGAGGFAVLRTTLPLGVWRERVALDWTVFAAAMLVALGSALAIALLPVLSLRRRNLNQSLAGARTSGILARGGLQSGMIVGEVALAVLLACGAGLIVRSVSRLYGVQPGFDAQGVAVLDVATPSGMKTSDRRRIMADILGGLATIPGVRVAAMTQRIPLRGPGWSTGFRAPGASASSPGANFRMVSRDYFTALRIPLLRGRTFDGSEQASDTLASIVVNDALVKVFYPNTDPIGQIVKSSLGAHSERIVGVVGNVAEGNLTDARQPARYYVSDQVGFFPGAQTIVLRVARDEDIGRTLIDAPQLIAKTAPFVAIESATSMSRVVDLAVGPARDVMSLLALLTALALALGAVGIYGVISQFVTRRNREWSIRVALGLTPMRVIGLIVRHGLVLVAAGIVAGIVGAVLFAKFLSSLLFGVSTHDPIAIGGASLVLLGVGTAAALIPALRAGRSDPAAVLREQ